MLEHDFDNMELTMRRCQTFELELLYRYSGLDPSEIKAYYKEVSPYCKLRTIEVGFPLDATDNASSNATGETQKPKLVFIHGYGASGATFWRIMKPLSEHYHVIFLDMPGMGGSTRVPFFCKTVE